MAVPLNQTLVKKENKLTVLQIVKTQSPISRAETAQITGLNKGTVSSLVAELITEEFIHEIGHGESSGGRKPVMLHFQAGAGYSIGIDLGVHYLLGLLTDLQGHIITKIHQPLHSTDLDSVVSDLEHLIQTLINQAPPSHYGVIGIGIGVPGIVSKDGTILSAPNLDWKRVEIKSRLMQRFDSNVWVDNEANFGAIGEKAFGSNVAGENILYVSAGIGIGAGLILGSELYKGAKGYAGEVGHMTMEMNGPLCRCGNSGCWELYASEQALLNKLDQVNSLEACLELAAKGNEEILMTFNQLAHDLGVGIVSLIHTFSPNQIIIGNRLSLAEKYLEAELHRTLQSRMLPEQLANTSIVFSSLRNKSTALGASGYASEQFLLNPVEHKKNPQQTF
ncbi:ROK family transcriptional regulator [Alkalicoccobacillus murimartini]|uniref:NBD/HSP70 family sugar kinase n=1 Tax=Alkalicoccobacillus murimartini TaxID=171685 RepID=A0ABT9YDS8_9BACI|nr:ROK family transcriptional regulator [Alkalicoccobacillus murimartini]MDQ0205999.1 putative NBD/HSP70 family sugar kinase [Alkalicoccobacillus murimartini]